jgi:hypothetical protein
MDSDKAGYTETSREAFGRLMAVTMPTVDDLKTLMVLEAGGKSSYAAKVRGTSNDAVKRILEQNGREELGHAMRLRQVIKIVHGETVVVPSDDANPFAVGTDVVHPVTKDELASIAGGEAVGGDLYDRWAACFSDEEAAKLLRQNGLEERRHGDRIREAAAFL